jgi:hypothetical protein
MTGTEPQFEHDKYEELCALATAGVLSAAENDALFAHLEECEECREAFAEYQSVATDGMAFLAKRRGVPPKTTSFDESVALTRLMKAAGSSRPRSTPIAPPSKKRPARTRILTRGSIAAVLLMGISIGAYRIGELRTRHADILDRRVLLSSALTQAAAEKQALAGTIELDNSRIAALEQQADASKRETEQLRLKTKTSDESLAAVTGSMNAANTKANAQIATLTQERDVNAAHLRDAERLYQSVQDEINTLRDQHRQDLLHMASLETRTDTLGATLKDESARAKSDEQLLSADGDIRDLIGARNLYIADIMDVDQNGDSRKAFGRVFYTKTKSLIFYAYDLDRQPGVRRTSIFQVWGRTGSNDHSPINLGILYMDSATNRRWTLRVDNPQELSRLDSIFVTIEPRQQIEKPTGKPFLYASLQRVPNHP